MTDLADLPMILLQQCCSLSTSCPMLAMAENRMAENPEEMAGRNKDDETRSVTGLVAGVAGLSLRRMSVSLWRKAIPA
ncbi:uncharacterized protein LOC141677079 isoform X2 [Apium graveolens]|uniref:uncharacterized protein LOC141677079 isoform X2 n=1 Tax=Apium graveolens TaxID=4045 RepID=UPI003D7BB90E